MEFALAGHSAECSDFSLLLGQMPIQPRLGADNASTESGLGPPER